MASVTSRRRSAVAAMAVSLVLGVLLFLGLSHGLQHEPMSGHDAAMGGAVAFCLVLFTVVAPLALAAPSRSRRGTCQRVDAVEALRPVALPLPQIGARASPPWLQRFQN